MQDGVSLSTNEWDLDIMYGNYNFFWRDKGSEKEILARASVKYILSDMNDIRKSYIRLGYHLDEFRRNKYYMDFGFVSMEDFCSANLGLDKSAVSRCISVFNEFSKVDDMNIHHMELDDRYKEYSYSQLCEMVSMNDEQRSQVKPDMTIKQIREIKKNSSSLSDSLDELDRLLNVSRDVSLVATSQQETFDTTNYSVKKGIVQQNYVRNCRSLYNVTLRIFDRDGKLISSDGVYDVLCSEPGTIYLREHVNEIVVNEFLR